MKNKKGETPLRLISSYGACGIVKLLCKHEAGVVDTADGEGRTPLSLAVEHGHEKVVKHLLDTGPSIDLAELQPLERPKWVTLEKREAMLQLVRDKQAARILDGPSQDCTKPESGD